MRLVITPDMTVGIISNQCSIIIKLVFNSIKFDLLLYICFINNNAYLTLYIAAKLHFFPQLSLHSYSNPEDNKITILNKNKILSSLKHICLQNNNNDKS